ncbi:MAG: hypothetical protein H7Y17_04955 [Chlorobia bacterium]|nr:hypothetical protein [Fimbriimonadaceae bacterium]
MAGNELDIREYLESKLEALRALPVDSAYYRFHELVSGPMDGTTLVNITVYSKARRQPLLRQVRHLYRDAPWRVRLNLFDTDKKPTTGGFLGFPLIESQAGWG